MNIEIKTKNIKLTEALDIFTRKKFSSLEKFLTGLKEESFVSPAGREKHPSTILVEIGKETKHHKKGPFFRAEVQVSASGNVFRAVSFSQDLRTAIDEVKDSIQREIKKGKEKLISIKKRKSRVLKNQTKLSSSLKNPKRERVLEEGI